MRRQTLIALAVAVVLGLVAVYLANAYLSRGEQRIQQAELGTTKVAVAAVPLDYGVDISPDKVKFIDYPSSSLPSGSFADYNQLAPAGKRRVSFWTCSGTGIILECISATQSVGKFAKG